jgi:hypothetical protein
MRKTLLFLLLLCTKLTFGQFQDDFSDGNFTENPAWGGQVSQFNITADKKLKTSLSAAAQTVSISTASYLSLNVKWEFSVQLNFDPSTANFTRIYLIADREDLNGDLNGYFLQIGESGSSDSYDLYKQTGKLITKILDCPAKNRVNANYLSTKIRVTRDNLGKWEVFSALPDHTVYSLEGSVVDQTFTQTNYFGVYAKYTATRSDGFTFDDFSVTQLTADVSPPSLVSIKIIDQYLEATFSEALSANTAFNTNNYLLKEVNEVPTLVEATKAPNVFLLRFARSFESGNYTLMVQRVKDLIGNELIANTEASTFFVKPYNPLKGDVVINEIFADPSPSVGLPQAEFVELWNTTANYIILTGWKYGDLTTTVIFSADTIKPNEHIILSAASDVIQFKAYGRTIGLATWPSLNNNTDRLRLMNAQNTVIDEVFYTYVWYKDDVKGKGGYSLELINPSNVCGGAQNWQASNHVNGGTPGVRNSVFQEQTSTTALKIVKVGLVDEKTIIVAFNQMIDSLSLSVVDHYHLNNGIGIPISAVPQAPDFSSVILNWAIPINKGIEHTLTINQLIDCKGNLINLSPNTVGVFFPKEILVNEVLISEVLVNPKVGGVDFIEIYNNSIDVKDLSTLRLATVDVNGNTFNAKVISDAPLHIPPQTYWVLTTNTEVVKEHYEAKNPTNFTQMASMPAYNNEKGTVILMDEKQIIDRFDYREDMHFPLLQIVKGVSLERVSFQKVANEKGNFRSAAQMSGFATPSYQNSQQGRSFIGNRVWLTNKVFSPDGDGFDDVLHINYELANHEFLATVTIFNENGLMIKNLVKNSSIPNAGYFTWDGINEAGALSKVGIYLIKLTFFALNGKLVNYERVCVLAAKL